MTETRSNRRFRRFLRLPSFGVALAVSLSVLVAFAVWMFVDASFPDTLQFLGVKFGLLERPWMVVAPQRVWDALGPRFVLFESLAAAGAAATLLVFYRVLVGNPRGRSLRALLISVALVALWLGLALYHENLESAGFRWRLRRVLPGLKQDAAILVAAWPTTDGELPYSGPYTAGGVPPILTLVKEYSFPMRDFQGPFVTRADDGGVRFDYGIDNGRVEYHPDGNDPSEKIVIAIIRWKVDYVVELEPNWYYVRYSPDDGQDGLKEPTQ